jgi:nitroreductase
MTSNPTTTPSVSDAVAQASVQFATVEAVITGRRSVKQFLAQPVPHSIIARLIELAVWAPNHRLTEPWRFYVLDGASRMRLGESAREITRAKLGTVTGSDPAVVERKAAEAAAAWASVPALVYVTALTDPRPDVDLENYGAVCCAVQNLMLAAHAAGLGTSWSSGAVAAAEDLRTLVGASANERMVGLIRVGYPDPAAPPLASHRTPGANYTTWVDEG